MLLYMYTCILVTKADNRCGSLQNFNIVGRKDAHPVLKLALPPIKLVVCPCDDLNHLSFPEDEVALHLSLEVVERLSHWHPIPVRFLCEMVSIHPILWVSSDRGSPLVSRGCRLCTTLQPRKDGGFGRPGLPESGCMMLSVSRGGAVDVVIIIIIIIMVDIITSMGGFL